MGVRFRVIMDGMMCMVRIAVLDDYQAWRWRAAPAGAARPRRS